MIRTGIVGLGTVSPLHLDPVADLSTTELVAVCDIDDDRVEEVAAEYGCAGYTDIEMMLDDEALDWVHLCTPLHSHFPLAKQCLNAGVHTLIEKPITESLDQYTELRALADDQGVRVTEVHDQAFYYPMRKALRAIRNGRLGRIRGVHVMWCEQLSPTDTPRGDWVQELSGGEFEEGFTHPTYLGLRFAGYPTALDDVTVDTVARRDYEDIAYDSMRVTFRSEDGVFCSIQHHSQSPPHRRVKIIGEEGVMDIDVLSMTATITPTSYLDRTPLAAFSTVLNDVRTVATTALGVGRMYASQTLPDCCTRVLPGIPPASVYDSHHQLIRAEADAIRGEASVVSVPEAETMWTTRIVDKVTA